MRGQPPGKSNEMRQQTTFVGHLIRLYIYIEREREMSLARRNCFLKID